jgi:hypothetical protein
VVLPGTLPAEIHSPDFDGDDQVNEADYEEFANAYQAAFDANYDLYCSDNLDLRDFVLFTRHVLHTAPVQTESTTWGRIKAMFPE